MNIYKKLPIILILLTLFTSGCSGSAGGIEKSASDAVKSFAEISGVPNQNMKYEVISNDGTFAQVKVTGQLRPSADSDWIEKETTIECRKVNEKWQCDQPILFMFKASQAQQQVNAAKATKAVATKVADYSKQTQEAINAAERGIKLVSMENSPQVGLEGTIVFWNLNLKNDDTVDHKVILSAFTSMQCDDHKLTNLDEHIYHIVKANSVEAVSGKYDTIMAACDNRTDPAAEIRILTVDGRPVSMPAEVFKKIEIQASNPRIQKAYAYNDRQEIICHIVVKNNDIYPHTIFGRLFSEVKYEHLGNEVVEKMEASSGHSTSVKFLPGIDNGFGDITMDLIKTNELDWIIATVNVPDANQIKSFTIQSLRLELVDKGLDDIPDEERIIDIKLPQCNIAQ